MKGSGLKRKLINARRVFVIGAHSFLRNAWLSVAATIVMTITLGCILVTLFASYTLNSTVKSFTDKIDVSIFFKNDATEEQIDAVTADLKNNPNLEVREITYISKEEARKSFEDQNQDDIKTLQAISQVTDAFPASIRVKTLDTAKLEEVVKVTRQDKYAAAVESDSYKDDAKRTAVQTLGNFAKFFQRGGLIATLIFGVISILVILNTIRMTIFNRKDEIEIMQLIGASKWYIRGPFLVEASIYGAIAGIIAATSFFLLFLRWIPSLGNYVEEVQPAIEKFSQLTWLIALAAILIGVFIGSFSSYLAIRKHLKLKTIK